MADPMQQAREFLAVAHEKAGDPLAAEAVRKGWNPVPTVELEAIAAALRATPECREGFVMVPVQTLESIRDSSTDPVARGFAEGALAARPQGVKDAT